MQWIVFLIALIGAVLNIIKTRWCFVLWLVSNGFWLVHNFNIGEFQQAACYTVFFVISIWGFVAWKSEQSLPKTCCEFYYSFKLNKIIPPGFRLPQRCEICDLCEPGQILHCKKYDVAVGGIGRCDDYIRTMPDGRTFDIMDENYASSFDPPAVHSQKIRNAATRLAAAASNPDSSGDVQEAFDTLMHQADVIETVMQIRKQKAKTGGKE